MDEDLQATFHELQRLPSEKLHELGDLLLPSIVAGLIGLKKHGLNSEGKTRKGTPDSFAGDAPATCRVAVEYTTQADELATKLSRDLTKVRAHCPLATQIVRKTSRQPVLTAESAPTWVTS